MVGQADQDAPPHAKEALQAVIVEDTASSEGGAILAPVLAMIFLATVAN